MLKNAKICRRIHELRDAAAAPVVKSITEVQARLSHLIDDNNTPAAVKVKAADTLLKSLGGYAPEIQINNSNSVNGNEETLIILPELMAEEDCLWRSD